MSHWKKTVLMVALAVAVFFAGLLVAAHLLVTPDRVRESILPLVKDSLHRDLQLGEIEISLFSGIVINDLVLMDQQGTAPFVTVDTAMLRYQLWPLLLLQVKVDELRLVRPHVEVLRLPDGTFNFSDMAGVSAGESQPAAAVADSGSTPFFLHISEVVITDGSVLFDDRSSGESARHQVSSLNLVVRDFSLTEPFQAAVSADWNRNSIALEGRFDLDDRSTEATVRLNSLQLEIKGDLLADAKGDRLRAEVKLPSILLADLLQSLPKGVVELPELPQLSGRLAAQVKLDGLLAEPRNLIRSGQLSLGDVTATTESIQAGVNGTVHLDGESVQAQHLRLKVNDQPLDLSLHIASFAKRPIAVEVTIRSGNINLERLIPTKTDAQPSAANEVPEKQQTEIGPYDLPVAVTGSIHIDSLLYRELSLQNLQCLFALKDNQLSIGTFTGDVAGGSFNQTGTLNLGVRGLQYTAETGLLNIELNPLVKALQPDLAESLFGVVTGSFNLSGAGTVGTTLKQNLSGAGRLDLTQAKLTRMPALDSAANLLGVAELKDIVIDDGQALFNLDKGVVAVDLQTNGPEFRQTTVGSVTLAGQLGLKTNLSLSPGINKKIDPRHTTGNVLIGKDGWSRIPLRIQGPYAAPKVSLDMGAVSRQARESAVDSLADKIKKKIGVDKNSDTTEADEDPAAKMVDDVLKGLFGN